MSNLRESNLTTQSKKVENNIKIDEQSHKYHRWIFGIIIKIWIVCSRLEKELNHSKDSVKILHNFQDNWSSSPILDIVSSNKTACPVGYEPLINDYFPGMKKGCYCEKTKELFPNSCDSMDDLEDHCKEIAEVGKETYRVYRTKLLCAKRAKVNYYNILKEGITEKKNCGLGKKTCGVIDSKGNLYCVNEQQACPINMIQFIDSQHDDFLDKYDYNFTIIELDNEKKLAFTNENVQGKVIVEFKIEDGFPCANPHYFNSASSLSKSVLHPFYQLDQCVPIKKDLNYDNRYEKLDKYSMEKVLEENKLKNGITKIPDFKEKNFSNPTFLHSRNYIIFDKKCMKNINEKIDDYYDDYKFSDVFLELAGKELANLNNKFYFLYMLVLLLTFVEVMYYMVVTKYLEEFEDTPRNWLAKIAVEGVQCFLLFLAGVVAVISMKKVYPLKKIFGFEDCSDVFTNIHFDSLESYLFYFYIENLIIIIVAIVGFVILCISIFKYSRNIENEEGVIDYNLKKVIELNKFH